MFIRGGVLEDVVGIEYTFSSPWPWFRSLQVLENVQSSARGHHYFLIGEKKKKTANLIVFQFVVSFRYLKNNTM